MSVGALPRWAIGLVVTGLLGAGCSAVGSQPAAAPSAGAMRASSQPSAGSSSASPSATQGASNESLRPSTRPVDDRTGKQLGRPFTVNGIVVVSAKHKVSAAYKPTVAAYGLTPAAGTAFGKLKRAIEKAGMRLWVVSSHRSHAAQKALYSSKLATMGRAYTQKYVAVPGTSEHQTGLAVDLRSPGGRGTSFDNSREWRWLRAHAQNYGFVLRYPDGLTKVTGIGFEPWHWRYVGVEQAKAIRALGANMTIEQYLRLA